LIHSFTLSSFWRCYQTLPKEIQKLADKQFALFKRDPFHPSLALAQKGEVWTVAVGRSYRAVARKRDKDLYWFWIGTHEAYNSLLKRVR
jgi:hypothetical protein